jgi:hypothetical protein
MVYAMKMKAVTRWFVLIVSASSILTCCTKIPDKIDLPDTSPLQSGSKYGVVTEDYLRVKISPDPRADDAFFLRKGSIVEITATGRYDSVDGHQNGLWFRISDQGRDGWVFSSDIEVHDTHDQAANAVKELNRK